MGKHRINICDQISNEKLVSVI